ncbi:MAG: hypothetical protein QXZ08_00755 [Nitrososphaeria archaeon]
MPQAQPFSFSFPSPLNGRRLNGLRPFNHARMRSIVAAYRVEKVLQALQALQPKQAKPV